MKILFFIELIQALLESAKHRYNTETYKLLQYLKKILLVPIPKYSLQCHTIVQNEGSGHMAIPNQFVGM